MMNKDQSNQSSLTVLAAFFLVLITALPVYADNYAVNMVAGDGSGGRVFRKWQQQIQNRPVSRVNVTLRRQSGGNDTYVNLRFGSGGTFENGKRVYLRDGGTKTVSWNVGGQRPNGQPLVLNVYKGEVFIENASVEYADQVQTGSISGGPPPRPPVAMQGGENNSASSTDEQLAVKRCRDLGRIRRPRIEISKLRASGGLFSGKFRLEGVVSGQCIEEAGYYERGRLKEEFAVPLDDRFRRSEFSLRVKSGKRGELRVYTIDGREDIVVIDEEIQDRNLL